MEISKASILFLVLPAITLCADAPILEPELQVREELPVDMDLTLPASREGHEITIPDTPSIVPTSPSEKLSPVILVDPPSTNLASDNPSSPTQPHSIVPTSLPENPSPVISADQPSTDLDSSEDLSSATEPDSPSHRSAVGLRFNELKGIGYEKGYTTVESFNLFGLSPAFMPWLDLRGHVFNDGKLAGNIGIGGRSLFSSINHMLGAFLYYDIRGAHRLTVNQLGPGLELLGKIMEYRLNGYFPVGKHQSSLYDRRFDTFKKHNIWLKTKQKQAMRGFDAEIGAHLAERSSYDIYLGVGPYYLNSSHASGWGGKVRLLGRYKDIFSLQATYSNDRLFGSIIQGEAAIRYTFGGKFKDKKLSKNERTVLHRARFAPSRLEIPVIATVRRHEKAINPATKAPWQVWFVDNTSHSLGTIESPFPTLLDAQTASGPNDIIYVFPGDGTTTGMDAGITLKDGQQLFGSGIAQLIPTTKGQLTIPAQSRGRPLITNLGGDVVSLANGNQVAGLGVLVSQAGATGIIGQGIQDTSICNNTIQGSLDHQGISIEGEGVVGICNNQLSSSANTPSLRAIRLQVVNNTSMAANISNNQIFGYLHGISFAPKDNPSAATGTAIIQGNNIAHFNQSGIFYPTGMLNSTVQILDNTILNDIGVAGGGSGAGAIAAISVSVNNAPSDGTVIIENNQIATTTSSINTCGIKAAINAGTGDRLAAIIAQNSVVTGPGSGSVGISLYSDNNDSICASLTGNQVTPTAASGTNDFTMVTNGSGTINIQNIADNIGSKVSVTGNVNFVSSCPP